MGAIQDFADKMSGKIDQAKGRVNKARGKHIKGGFQEVGGKLKEEWADAKLRGRQNDIDYDHETM